MLIGINNRSLWEYLKQTPDAKKRVVNLRYRSRCPSHGSPRKSSIKLGWNLFRAMRFTRIVDGPLWDQQTAILFANVIRPLRVVGTRWWMAASGKRNFTDCFPATNLTRGRSHQCTQPPIEPWKGGRSKFKVIGAARLHSPASGWPQGWPKNR